jgi:UDP-3-O-[3-hydroxymyristoyl] glucosamine N-acyltransferase
MQFTATQIAALLQGTIVGDANATVTGFGKIEEATPGELCFLANPKYNHYIYTTQASIAIVSKDIELNNTVTPTLIKVAEPYAAFAILLQQYETVIKQMNTKVGVEQPSVIHETVSFGENIYIGAFSHIGKNVKMGNNVQVYPGCIIGDNVSIGDNTILYAGVKIYYDCKVGANCNIHAGVVIGSDGFGFAKSSGVFNKIPQIGNVIIEDDVEMGANCCVDRATMGSTFIRKGVKLDNMVQVAHNVEIGAHTVISGMTALGGSCKIGSGVMIGGQAGIVGHITIADGAMINAQSGVTKAITENNFAVTGSPALEFKNAMKSQAVYKNLPILQSRINALEHQLKELLAKQ